MNEFILETVRKHSGLSHTPHGIDGKCRIFRNDLNGALWISPKPRFGAYDVETTGDVASFLDGELTKRFGRHLSENSRGYKLWRIENQKDLDDIIRYFG